MATLTGRPVQHRSRTQHSQAAWQDRVRAVLKMIADPPAPPRHDDPEPLAEDIRRIIAKNLSGGPHHTAKYGGYGTQPPLPTLTADSQRDAGNADLKEEEEAHQSIASGDIRAPRELIAATIMHRDGIPLLVHDDAVALRVSKHLVGMGPLWTVVSRLRYGPDHKIIRAGKFKTPVRTVDIGKGIDVSIYDSFIEVATTRGWHDLRSRHDILLDAYANLAQTDIFNRGAQTMSDLGPSFADARSLMKRTLAGKVTTSYVCDGKTIFYEYPKATIGRYEWDLVVYGDVGKQLYDLLALRDICSNRYSEGERGTIWLRGWKRYDGLEVAIKYYSVGVRDGQDDLNDLYKLEITFLSPYFRRYKIGIGDLGTQSQMQRRIYPDLVKQLDFVLRPLSPHFTLMRKLQIALHVQSFGEIIPAILSPKLTLTERVLPMAEQHDPDHRGGGADERRRSVTEAEGMTLSRT